MKGSCDVRTAHHRIGRDDRFQILSNRGSLSVTMLDDWVRHSVELGLERTFYAAQRKVIRGRSIEFGIDDSLQLSDAGYTGMKLNLLRKHYLHPESQSVALELWNHRKSKNKYGSVSFTTFNHFVKGKGTVDEIIAKNKIGSIFGPCIQSVCITYLSRQSFAVDVFYRTTEFMKKFPADLVFIRDVLIEPFELPHELTTLTTHFANITMHPMYFVTIVPHIDDPIATLRMIKSRDPKYHEGIIKWTARYLVDSTNLVKFMQGMRVKKDVESRVPKYILRRLTKYVSDEFDALGRSSPDEDDEETDE